MSSSRRNSFTGRTINQPLRYGWDKLQVMQIRGQLQYMYPKVAHEMELILRECDFSVYEIPECPEYRAIVAPDPRKQYKALVVYQKVSPGIAPGKPFWAPIKPNMHTGPAIRGFDSMMKAMMHAHTWLEARVKGKVRAKQQRFEFMKAKGIKQKGKNDGTSETP